MRKFYYYLITLFILFSFSGCERFAPPEIKLQVVNQGDTLQNFYAIITDGGGETEFYKKGCVYGFSTEPTLLDGKSTSFEMASYQKSWFFDWSMPVASWFWTPDTTYYVRAWVKNNAGIGYSNSVRVKTLPSTDIFKK